jgi:hypothetical protein
MKLSELKEQLTREAGYPEGEDDFEALITNWIDDVIKEIWDFIPQLKEKTINVNTQANVSSYPLEPHVAEIKHARYTDNSGVRLTPIDSTVSNDLRNSFELTAQRPYNYWIDEYAAGPDHDPPTPDSEGQISVHLYPMPDTVYPIEFTVTTLCPTLADDDDIPFPSSFIKVIKEGVRVFIKDDDEDFEASDRASARYREGLQRLKVKHSVPRNYTTKMRVSDVRGNRYPDELRLSVAKPIWIIE